MASDTHLSGAFEIYLVLSLAVRGVLWRMILIWAAPLCYLPSIVTCRPGYATTSDTHSSDLLWVIWRALSLATCHSEFETTSNVTSCLKFGTAIYYTESLQLLLSSYTVLSLAILITQWLTVLIRATSFDLQSHCRWPSMVRSKVDTPLS